MKRALGFLLAVGLGITLDRFGSVGHASAAAGVGQGGGSEQCATKIGDVNADGKVGVSDAVTILGYLFRGNPTALASHCDALPTSTSLPATGQSACYQQLSSIQWTEIPCGEAFCSGQDGFYATGCQAEGRFTDNSDGTVTDHCTGLMWQKDTADVNGNGQTGVDNSDALDWCSAVRYCENLSLAGHNDWRLPNVRELQSIANYGRAPPSVEPAFRALPVPHWSSTSFAGDRSHAWVVQFNGGEVTHDGKIFVFYVRAVRSGV